MLVGGEESFGNGENFSFKLKVLQVANKMKESTLIGLHRSRRECFQKLRCLPINAWYFIDVSDTGRKLEVMSFNFRTFKRGREG